MCGEVVSCAASSPSPNFLLLPIDALKNGAKEQHEKYDKIAICPQKIDRDTDKFEDLLSNTQIFII